MAAPSTGGPDQAANLLLRFTPGQLAPELLAATLVAREPLLTQILDRVEQWEQGAGPEHFLLLGFRGMGKTHLLELVRYRVEAMRDENLRVVPFHEESYGLGGASDLLLAVWKSVGEPGVEPPADGSTTRWIEDQLLRLSEQRRMRVLILLDSFELKLESWREEDESILRHVLASLPNVMVVAAANWAPNAVTEYGRPLFDYFRVEPLRSLSPSDADEMLRRRAELSGHHLLDRWKEIRPRILAIADLAGGNPRLLLSLYQALQGLEIPSVLAAFRSLLDEVTPYFKHLVESRAPQQRRLLALAAKHDRGASPSELAAESGIQDRQVAALLGPLVRDGFLRRVRRPGSKATAYVFNEPILRMWLQTRETADGARRVACLVEFFRRWYERAEGEYEAALRRFVTDVDVSSRAVRALGIEDRALSLEHFVRAAPSLQAAENAASLIADPEAGIEAPVRHRGLNAAHERVSELQLAAFVEARDLLSRADELRRRGAFERAIKAYDAVIACCGVKPTLSGLVARAFLNRGVTLGSLGCSEEEIEVYDKLVSRYSDRPEAEIAVQVARALVNKGITLGSLGRSEEEIEVYDKLESQYGDRLEAEIAVQVARALVNKGITLGSLGRSEEEIEVYDKLVSRYGDRPEAEIAVQVARALVNKGFCLGGQDHLEEEIEVYNELVSRYAASPEAEIAERVAMALHNRGDAWYRLGNFDLSLADLDESIRRRSSHAPTIADRARTLAALGRAADGLADLRLVVETDLNAEQAEILNLLVAFLRGSDMRAARQALELIERATSEMDLAPYRFALQYLEANRDPYLLETLSPDVRRAVTLIVEGVASPLETGSPD